MKNRKGLAWLIASLLIVSLVASACGKKEDDTSTSDAAADTEVSGSVVVSGSSTVEPITSGAAEAFRGQNDQVEISVDGPGTGDGFKLFCAGETDISDASRAIKEEEVESCTAEEIEFIELPVALDGMSVIVNPELEIECLSFVDLYALIGPESQGFKNWTDAQELAKELGSDTTFPDAPLDITAPGEESGTYDSFIEIALADTAEKRLEEGKITEDQAETTRPDYQASANDNAIVQGIEGSPGGLGWVGFAYAASEGENLKTVPLTAEPGGECVAPTQETISDGTYPLARTLYIYVNAAKAESNAALSAFVDFYLEGLEGFVDASGYTNLTAEQIEATNTTWADRTTGTTSE